nr:hypothetical protein [Vibrio mimicus]
MFQHRCTIGYRATKIDVLVAAISKYKIRKGSVDNDHRKNNWWTWKPNVSIRAGAFN